MHQNMYNMDHKTKKQMIHNQHGSMMVRCWTFHNLHLVYDFRVLVLAQSIVNHVQASFDEFHILW